MNFLPRSLLGGLVAAVVGVMCAASSAAPYQGLLVLGDSLSDSGNNAALGLYSPGQTVTNNRYIGTLSYGPDATYTNGPVWASYLASMMGVTLRPSLRGGSNFANGGALLGSPGIGPFGYPFSLKVQAERFLNAVGGVAPADVLYVVAGGGNDARDALAQIGTLPLGTPAGDAQAFEIFDAVGLAMVQDITSIVDSLQAAGAQDIIVWNLPNLGLVPAIGSARGRSIAAAVTAAWNDSIEAALAGEIGVSIFDLYGVGSEAAADPAAFGLTNVLDACGAAPSGTDCSTYLWWDGIHPSTRAHELIADEMAALIGLSSPTLAAARFAGASDVPAPQSLALLAFGLVTLGGFISRKRVAA